LDTRKFDTKLELGNQGGTTIKIVLGKESLFFSVDDFNFINSMDNNLTPKTISEKEQQTLAFWQENKVFEKSVETPAARCCLGVFLFMTVLRSLPVSLTTGLSWQAQ